MGRATANKLSTIILFAFLTFPVEVVLLPLIIGFAILFYVLKVQPTIIKVILILFIFTSSLAAEIFWMNLIKDPLLNYFQDRYAKTEIQSLKATPTIAPIPKQTTNVQTEIVLRVVDGDTIELSNGKKVRYIGINTPETHHPTKPIECFGLIAAEKNKELVEGKQVKLVKDISETDRYGRLLRYVYVDNLFVNKELVEQGYAYADTFPPDVKFKDVFVKAQNDARQNNKGLWKECPVKE